jgi:hypothetical protein
MDAIEPDELYEERNGVSYARPIIQGDIFEQVVVPGLGDEPRTVQVVMHPCSMRRGAAMVSRIQVAPIESYDKVGDWNQHVRVMPLPDLNGDGKHFAAKFVDKTAVPTSELTLNKRVASLSQKGILVLQQRIVMDDSRVDIDVSVFRAQSAPVLAEAEMQEIWVETILGADIRDEAAVESVGVGFQAWLDESGKRRRAELGNEANHAQLRRATRAEASARRHAQRN